MTTLIIAGRGASAADFVWPDEPIMGISSGYEYVPRMDHWCSLDKPMHFPRWLTDSERFQKHVPVNSYIDEWRKCPQIVEWKYVVHGQPVFDSPDAPIVSGPLPRNHSMFFGVQVAARLGFTRCVFIGCDLLDNELHPIADVLRAWYPIARRAGIEWVNASRMSILGEWMPTAEEALCVS